MEAGQLNPLLQVVDMQVLVAQVLLVKAMQEVMEPTQVEVEAGLVLRVLKVAEETVEAV